MILNIAQFFENELKKELKVSHLEKKIDCKVVETSKVNKKMKDAIGKEEMKDGDILIGIVEMNAAPVEQPKEEPKEEEPKDDADTEKEETDNVEANDADTSTDDAEKEGEGEEENKEEEGEEENKEEEVKEEPKEEKKEEKEEKEEPAEEKTNDEKEDDKKKKKEDKEELNESIKVQDLTASMLSPMKTVKPKKCSCVKEGECSKKKKAKAKPSFMPVAPIDHEGEQGTPYAGGGEGGDVGGVEEAETEATGEELKVKVLKCLQKLTKEQETDSNKIEIKEVPGMTGVYYAMIKFGTVGVEKKEEEVG